MIRTLLIIAGAALVLAIATLGGAAAIGGQDLARHGWTWTFHDGDGDTVRFERDDGTRAPDVTRTLAWTGGNRLVLDLAADVTYVQGPEAGVVVTGPKSVTDRVVLDGDRLTMTEGDDTERVTFGWDHNGPTGWAESERLRITVTAPSVVEFDVVGSSDLTISSYDQETLAVNISGSGEVSATGRTRSLEVDISGSGDADLGSLTTIDANVAIAGSGDATVAPTGKADISIAGSGDVDLTTRPATVNQDILGSGDVNFDRVTTRITTTREIARAPGVSVSTSTEVPVP